MAELEPPAGPPPPLADFDLPGPAAMSTDTEEYISAQTQASEWSVQQVGEWAESLASLGPDQAEAVAAAVEAEEIDGDALLTYDKSDLKSDLGLKGGSFTKLWKAIDHLRQPTAAASPALAGVLRLPLPGSSSAVLEPDRADPAARLGAGGSGVVFRGWRVSKSGARVAVAVKTLPFGATPADLEKFRKEVSLLRRAAGGCNGVSRLLEEPSAFP